MDPFEFWIASKSTNAQNRPFWKLNKACDYISRGHLTIVRTKSIIKWNEKPPKMRMNSAAAERERELQCRFVVDECYGFRLGCSYSRQIDKRKMDFVIFHSRASIRVRTRHAKTNRGPKSGAQFLSVRVCRAIVLTTHHIVSIWISVRSKSVLFDICNKLRSCDRYFLSWCCCFRASRYFLDARESYVAVCCRWIWCRICYYFRARCRWTISFLVNDADRAGPTIFCWISYSIWQISVHMHGARGTSAHSTYIYVANSEHLYVLLHKFIFSVLWRDSIYKRRQNDDSYIWRVSFRIDVIVIRHRWPINVQRNRFFYSYFVIFDIVTVLSYHRTIELVCLFGLYSLAVSFTRFDVCVCVWNLIVRVELLFNDE